MVVIGAITEAAITIRAGGRPLTMAGRRMALSAIHLPVWMLLVPQLLRLALLGGLLVGYGAQLAARLVRLAAVSTRETVVVAERVAIAIVVGIQVTAVVGNVTYG
ncbi:hypothetical protein BFS14_01285 [Serratia fonticola]|nr:hypothetical protein BFS14_01285 [Serratia fonticola]